MQGTLDIPVVHLLQCTTIQCDKKPLAEQVLGVYFDEVAASRGALPRPDLTNVRLRRYVVTSGTPAVRVLRGEIVEAEHEIIVAVIDGDGRLTHAVGDPDRVFMTRSSVKPFQVLPVITSGALDAFGFAAHQLAVMCASHNGTDEHRQVVASNLERIGLSAEQLQCGTHRPMFMEIEGTYPTAGEDRDPVRHNCSGKHSGFLALAKHIGEPVERYLDPGSEVQQRVKQAVALMCEYPEERIEIGIDGCSAPVFSMSVRHLAIGFKNLAMRRGGAAGDPAVAKALERGWAAMTGYPHLVAGTGRFDYDLMRSMPGRVVSKLGAESIRGLAFNDPPLGICVKVRDGGMRALGPVCVHVLRQLGLIEDFANYPHLQRYVEPAVRNARNIVTGRIVVDFNLDRL
ncbi:asparaginase [candidate division GN15 bacterium]|nr:asparaginase [candidate division GN15 bacterium]